MNGKLAVVGCGNWGRNLVRDFCQLLGADRIVCCDERPDVLHRLSGTYPGISTVADVGSIWADSSITAVAIAVPVPAHYAIAKQALLAGKHAFVEKPLATSTAQAEELCDLAEREQRVLMVDHLLLFHPAVQELGRRIEIGELGAIYHLYGQRTNLGVVRSEENALWSLGPHDLAVMLSFVGEAPVRVAAQGGTYLQPQLGVHDVVSVTLVFPAGQVANLQLSWLYPGKTRQLTIVGSRKMAVFDDLRVEEKLRIYDVGVEFPSGDTAPFLRNGGTDAISIASDEPLTLACQHFLDSIDVGHVSLSAGRTGLDVVRVLEAAQASLEGSGKPIYSKSP